MSVALLLLQVLAAPKASNSFTFQDAAAMFKAHCVACHQGKAAAGALDLTRFKTPESVVEQSRTWTKVLSRVRNSEMPPKGRPALPLDTRDAFIAWVDGTL